MNIWIINHFAYGPDQSAGTRHYEFARNLGNRGHNVLIVASSFYHKNREEIRLSKGEDFRRDFVYDVPFQWIKTPAYHNSSAKRLWNMVVFAWRVVLSSWKQPDEHPDIIIGSSPSLLAAFAGFILSKRLKVPFVLEIRDIWPDSLRDVAGLSKWHPVYVIFKRIERFLYRNSDRIITLLPNSFDHMVDHGAEKKKIVWIPNGVILSERAPLPNTSHANPFRITYFGAHGQYNGLSTVIETAKILQKKGWTQNQVRFVLLGEGPLKQSLIKQAKDLDVWDLIEFRDAVPKKRLWDVIQDSDVFLMIVKPMECFEKGMSPNKLWDYFAAARPVIFSMVGGDKMAKETRAGIAVEPGNPVDLATGVERLLSMSIEERIILGKNGRKYISEQGDIARLSERLENELTKTIEKYGIYV